MSAPLFVSSLLLLLWLLLTLFYAIKQKKTFTFGNKFESCSWYFCLNKMKVSTPTHEKQLNKSFTTLKNKSFWNRHEKKFIRLKKLSPICSHWSSPSFSALPLLLRKTALKKLVWSSFDSSKLIFNNLFQRSNIYFAYPKLLNAVYLIIISLFANADGNKSSKQRLGAFCEQEFRTTHHLVWSVCMYVPLEFYEYIRKWSHKNEWSRCVWYWKTRFQS